MSLVAATSGSPKPIVRWWQEDIGALPEDVVQDDDKLVFQSVSHRHEGKYYVLATNVLGRTIREVTLEVLGKYRRLKRCVYFENKCIYAVLSSPGVKFLMKV